MSHGRIDQHERGVVELIKQEGQLQVCEVRQYVVRVNVADGQCTRQRRKCDGSQQPMLSSAMMQRRLSALSEATMTGWATSRLVIGMVTHVFASAWGPTDALRASTPSSDS